MTELELRVSFGYYLVGDSRVGTVKVVRSIATFGRGAIANCHGEPAEPRFLYFFLCGSTKKEKKRLGTAKMSTCKQL